MYRITAKIHEKSVTLVPGVRKRLDGQMTGVGKRIFYIF